MPGTPGMNATQAQFELALITARRELHAIEGLDPKVLKFALSAISAGRYAVADSLGGEEDALDNQMMYLRVDMAGLR